jgi:beta-galactosidase/beta-glucuronidase
MSNRVSCTKPAHAIIYGQVSGTIPVNISVVMVTGFRSCHWETKLQVTTKTKKRCKKVFSKDSYTEKKQFHIVVKFQRLKSCRCFLSLFQTNGFHGDCKANFWWQNLYLRRIICKRVLTSHLKKGSQWKILDCEKSRRWEVQSDIMLNFWL